MMLDPKNTHSIQRPRMIVMPFQPADGQAFDGIGLGIHFFLGNLLGVHGGLTECWFGWRVKKIFPETSLFKTYCRVNNPFFDIQELGRQQKVRFWLEGSYRQEGEDIPLSLVLHDTEKQGPASKICLSLSVNDALSEGRTVFFEWLETCGLTFVGIEKASWPENISCQGLNFLGCGLKALYLTYIQGDGSNTNLIDLTWFDRSVDVSKDSYLAQDLRGWALYKNGEYALAKKAFALALELNPDGLGALSGMMWCALVVNDRKGALHYALLKAGCRGEDLEKARKFVDKKFEALS